MRDEQGLLKRKIAKFEGPMNPESDDLSQSKSIAQLPHTSSFFTHCLSAGGLMLLVYESSVYLRSERQCEWNQCMTFDSLILALSSIGTNENQETRFVCITETAIEILLLDHDKKAIESEK